MKNLFNDEFILSVKSNLENKSYVCLIEILEMAIESGQNEHYIEALHLLDYITEKFEIDVLSNISFDDVDDTAEFRSFFIHLAIEIQPKILKDSNLERFDSLFSNTFSYEFSEEDVNKIQTLINELRDELNSSELFEDEHKERLLKRLEDLQKEMHKKMANIDKIWGLLGDAGVVIGKFGKDVKPFTDRIIELAKIGWKTQAKAEGLSESIQNPLLGIN